MQYKVKSLNISFSVSVFEPKQSALRGYAYTDKISNIYFKLGNDIQNVFQSMAVISWRTN